MSISGRLHVIYSSRHAARAKAEFASLERGRNKTRVCGINLATKRTPQHGGTFHCGYLDSSRAIAKINRVAELPLVPRAVNAGIQIRIACQWEDRLHPRAQQHTQTHYDARVR